MTITLLPQPGRRPGALMAPYLDQRPCVTHPPQWWDTGHEHNDLALILCAGCPLTDQCMPPGAMPSGVIRNGVAYDDHGQRAPICPTCQHPRTRRTSGGRATCHCPKTTTRGDTR